MVLLAIDGIICAFAAALLLPLYIGAVPFPISAFVAGAVNMALVWAAMPWTASNRVAALPLWTWLGTVGGLTFGGPGGDIIFQGPGISGYRVLLLIVVGTGPAVWLLWRRGLSQAPVRRPL